MIQNFTKVFRRAFDVIFKRAQVWGDINNEDTNEQELFKSYTLPLICSCVAMVFAFNLLYANGFQIAFLKSVLSALSLFGAYFICKWVLLLYLQKNFDPKVSSLDVAKLVTYGFTAIYFQEILLAVMPGFYMLYGVGIYSYVLLSDAYKVLFDLPLRNFNNTLLLSFLLVVFLPVFLTVFVTLFLPNAQL